MVYAARLHAGEIFEINPAYFRRVFNRTNVPELKKLLYNPEKPDEKCPMWPAMLFPSRDCTSNRPFEAEELVKVSPGIYLTDKYN